MNKLFLNVLFSSSLVLTGLAGFATAQEPPDAAFGPPKPADVRANALKQLGLNREQMFEIRKINQARRPQMEQAQERLRTANRVLDSSIYSDSVSEELFQQRLRDFQAAQAEVARIRFANELAVRRILNPEQVARFRQIRERFDRQRQAGGGALLGPRKQMQFPKQRRPAPIFNK